MSLLVSVFLFLASKLTKVDKFLFFKQECVHWENRGKLQLLVQVLKKKHPQVTLATNIANTNM